MALLPTEQAYKALGFKTPEALQKAAKRGTFRSGAHKVGRSWRFNLDQIERQTEYQPFRRRHAQ